MGMGFVKGANMELRRVLYTSVVSWVVLFYHLSRGSLLGFA
jgi:hypothetical protein